MGRSSEPMQRLRVVATFRASSQVHLGQHYLSPPLSSFCAFIGRPHVAGGSSVRLFVFWAEMASCSSLWRAAGSRSERTAKSSSLTTWCSIGLCGRRMLWHCARRCLFVIRTVAPGCRVWRFLLSYLTWCHYWCVTLQVASWILLEDCSSILLVNHNSIDTLFRRNSFGS